MPTIPGLTGATVRLRQIVMGLQRFARERAGLEIFRYWPSPQQSNVLALTISDVLLRRVLAGGQSSDFTFLQIGANDGVTGDPIHDFVLRYGFRGVCVEPQPDAFARLEATYRDVRGVICEPVAIAEADGEAILYRFRPGPHVPLGADLLASFSRDVLVANTHGIEGDVEELRVPTVSIATLLARHHLTAIDLVQMDTEGFDYEIIKLLLPHMQPTILNFEVGVLTPPVRQECYAKLMDLGYKITMNGVDAVAYKEPSEQALQINDWSADKKPR
jgi:FkbM family methyltransferase